VNPVPLNPAQIDRAAEMLTRAFRNDPLLSWILPDPEKRRSLSPPFHSVFLRYGLLAGEVWTSDPTIRGLAVFLPPEQREMNAEMLERSGFNGLESILGQEAFGRFQSALDYMAPLRSSGAPVSHWYTMALGVDPEHQGTGIGRMLLNCMFQRADSEHVPCYLETTEPKNVAFYTNSGFNIVHDGTDPASGVHYWTFRRDPPPTAGTPALT
jgi:GNAT superfamily N-acetyltransferase